MTTTKTDPNPHTTLELALEDLWQDLWRSQLDNLDTHRTKRHCALIKARRTVEGLLSGFVTLPVNRL